MDTLWRTAALWSFCAVFFAPLRKRPRGWLRALLLLAAELPLACLLPFSHTWLGRLIPCLLSALFFLLCADLSVPSALYCGVWSQTLQQLMEEAGALVWWSFRSAVPWGSAGWAVAGLAYHAAGLAAVGLTIARWMPVDGTYRVGPRQLALALVLQGIFVSLYSLTWTGREAASPLYGALILLAELYCVTMLYLQYNLFAKSAMRHELEILNRLRCQQKEQYELARETIAIINRKCHDMKHQIAALRAVAGPEQREKYLREVEESVRIYGCMIKTGNEVLDTLLTEKSLTCEANGIQINCIADGASLNFMDPVDIYTMLGNALDNAAESVQRLEQPDERQIDVLICQERGVLLLQVVNALKEDLAFEDGLPRSTKPHDGYHGFGLKSIRHTAERYGGFTSIRADQGRFTLKILIPLAE